ncbi:MAG: FIST N-terminal domain-containing protein, partial [Polyangiaceae bacterium]
MRVEQRSWSEGSGWVSSGSRCDDAQLVLAFGATALVDQSALWQDLRTAWPRAHIMACSTAGEIAGTQVTDDSLVATALRFERSEVRCASVRLVEVSGSLEAGRELARRLEARGLRHVFVLSDGLKVNGSELVQGLAQSLPVAVAVTGGLSGDGSRFARTLVGLDGPPQSECVVAVGFYGDGLRVGFGSLGGWDPFGPDRLVTKSRGAVLDELDGQPALELYKRYLGEYAKDLPASGLLFPLTVRQDDERGVVRTILAVDEATQSLTFAGDVPEGARARLMRANFDRLVDGASGAAKTCHDALRGEAADLAILISCVGRKLVLQQRIEEEV